MSRMCSQSLISIFDLETKLQWSIYSYASIKQSEAHETGPYFEFWSVKKCSEVSLQPYTSVKMIRKGSRDGLNRYAKPAKKLFQAFAPWRPVDPDNPIDSSLAKYIIQVIKKNHSSIIQ